MNNYSNHPVYILTIKCNTHTHFRMNRKKRYSIVIITDVTHSNSQDNYHLLHIQNVFDVCCITLFITRYRGRETSNREKIKRIEKKCPYACQKKRFAKEMKRKKDTYTHSTSWPV
jgi:hypothetical protein